MRTAPLPTMEPIRANPGHYFGSVDDLKYDNASFDFGRLNKARAAAERYYRELYDLSQGADPDTAELLARALEAFPDSFDEVNHELLREAERGEWLDAPRRRSAW